MCDSAFSITIIPDGWTPVHVKLEYLGVVGLLINDRFEKSLVVFGLEDLPDGHSAEHIKTAMERLINYFNFDKSKIRGKI